MSDKNAMAADIRKKAENTTSPPAVEPEPTKEIKITALGDLPSRDTEIRVEMDNHEVLVFPGRALTYKRWNEIGRLVSDPEPPTGGFDKQGRPIYNLNDPGYINQKQEAADKRMYYRLVEFLQMDIPGDSMDAKVEALSDAIEFRIMKALITGVSQEHFSGAGVSASARAATFHTNGDIHVAGDGAA
jgi:hypothetical protein